MRHLFVIAVAVMLSLPVAAQDFGKGEEAYERGDYSTALREWRPLAEQGEAQAQYRLGFLYQFGQGVPQDYERAVMWYRKAADQGYANGQFYLGFMYSIGLGVTRNIAQGHMWFNLAAAQGHKDAIKHRERLAKSMTSAEILAAQRLAREWMEKHGK